MRFLVNRIPLKMRKATNNTHYVAVEFVVCLFFALDSRTDISSDLPHLSSQNVLPCSRIFIPSFLLHNSHNFALRKHIRKRKQYDRGAFVNLNCYCNKNKTRNNKAIKSNNNNYKQRDISCIQFPPPKLPSV